VSVSSAFLWRFLDDVWDLLPTKDRSLFESYWSGLIQVASDLEQKTIEAGLSNEISTVPVFLTDRWNRYSMDEENTDTFDASDSLTLLGSTLSRMSKEAGFYDTLKVSLPSGQIAHEETMQFFDQSVRHLRYGKIVKGTISIVSGDFEYTQNRDYAINVADGSIQTINSGRIPIDDIVTIRYLHEEYTRGLDYEIDELNSGVYRTASTVIPDGKVVTASYSYNSTATLPLEGSSASIKGAELTDLSKDFSTLLPSRTLTISSGPNSGEYSVNSVLSTNKIQISTSFPVDQETDVVYSINAFPYGLKIDKQVVSIPLIQDRVDLPSSVMVEGIDYVLRDGIFSCRTAFRISELGSESTRTRQMWAEVTKVDKETPYRNFGVLIDFYRKNSDSYKLALQGLWYTFWTGSTPGNLERGLHILLGLPFARKAGTVTRVDSTAGIIEITDGRGQIITYTIPSELEAEVSRGDEVFRFQQLTTGVEIVDRNNYPGFVSSHIGRAGIQRFLTDNATRGSGSSDETRALTLLENHLLLPQVLASAVTERVNVSELTTFLDNMKPSWTEYVFSFAVEEDESLLAEEDLGPVEPALNLTTTISNNEWNQSYGNGNFSVESSTGKTIGIGSIAAGNFSDISGNFIANNVKPGDFLQIFNQTFKGYHRVIEVFSLNLLSIDIPDSDLAEEFSLSYVIIPKERAGLNHDSVCLARENIIMNGSAYSTPATLNTKTDIDFSETSIEDDDVLSLLLVDIGITGDEVQVITAADVISQEFSVGTPPAAPISRDHQLASTVLKRTDNSGPTVTDAFAI